VPADWIVPIHASVAAQHGNEHGQERLGAGGDLKNRIARHRFLLAQGTHARPLEVDDLSSCTTTTAAPGASERLDGVGNYRVQFSSRRAPAHGR